MKILTREQMYTDEELQLRKGNRSSSNLNHVYSKENRYNISDSDSDSDSDYSSDDSFTGANYGNWLKKAKYSLAAPTKAGHKIARKFHAT